jgi:indoleamine 2,3-dioxygenase
MRNYMPGPHRKFLEHMDTIANIREYVMTSASGPDVTDAYNLAVQRLGEFRDKHIKIVTRYIIAPSKKLPSTRSSGLNLAVASTNGNSAKKLHGTGGTELLPFLKQSRDETKETALR